METEFKGLNLSSRFEGEKNAIWDDGKYPQTMDRHHVVTVEYDGNKIEFDYYPSIANPSINTEKELLEAFRCFLSDADSGSMSLDDFANEFYGGTGKVSQIVATHKACQKSYYDFLELMGIGDSDFYDKYSELMEALEEEGVA